MFKKGSTAIEGLSGKGNAILSLEATSVFAGGGDLGFDTFPGGGGVPFSWRPTSADGGAVAEGFSGKKKREYNCQPALRAITSVAKAFKNVGVFFQYFNPAFFNWLNVAALKMTAILRLSSLTVINFLKG
jgi:hypothetical protein